MSKPLFSWRDAILCSDLQPTTRLVLLTLSCYMNDVGGSCFPSVQTLSKNTGLSKKSVITHLHKARDAGWIRVGVHGFKGQKWRAHEYVVGIPKGGELFTPGPPKGGEPDAKGGEPDDQKVVNEVHPNSPENSQNNSPASGGGQSSLLGQPTQPPNGAKYSEDFLEFWKVYPRSEGKKPAYAAWKKLPPEDRKRALEDCRRRYADTEKQYVPHASTYLNQERWEDDLPPKKPDPEDPEDTMVIY